MKNPTAVLCTIRLEDCRHESWQGSINTVHCWQHQARDSSMWNQNYYSWPLPPMCLPSLPNITTWDQIPQDFPLCICILQVIKYWRWKWLGNETTVLWSMWIHDYETQTLSITGCLTRNATVVLDRCYYFIPTDIIMCTDLLPVSVSLEINLCMLMPTIHIWSTQHLCRPGRERQLLCSNEMSPLLTCTQ